MSDDHERIARCVADCLIAHLHEVPGCSWEPYRYPSGEHKGVEFAAFSGYSEVRLFGADGSQFVLNVVTHTPPIPKGKK